MIVMRAAQRLVVTSCFCLCRRTNPLAAFWRRWAWRSTQQSCCHSNEAEGRVPGTEHARTCAAGSGLCCPTFCRGEDAQAADPQPFVVFVSECEPSVGLWLCVVVTGGGGGWSPAEVSGVKNVHRSRPHRTGSPLRLDCRPQWRTEATFLSTFPAGPIRLLMPVQLHPRSVSPQK